MWGGERAGARRSRVGEEGVGSKQVYGKEKGARGRDVRASVDDHNKTATIDDNN